MDVELGIRLRNNMNSDVSSDEEGEEPNEYTKLLGVNPKRKCGELLINPKTAICCVAIFLFSLVASIFYPQKVIYLAIVALISCTTNVCVTWRITSNSRKYRKDHTYVIKNYDSCWMK